MELRRQMAVAAVVVAGLLLSAGEAAAGPWVPAPGEIYAKVSGSYFDGTTTFDRGGEEIDPEYDYSHYAVRAYADIGVLPHVGLSASVPFLIGRNRRQTEDGPARYVKRGFGDLDLALQG
ncbi:MAG: hypothetical protein ABEL76_14930, partial [Bradymonadaceae bacterium]